MAQSLAALDMLDVLAGHLYHLSRRCRRPLQFLYVLDWLPGNRLCGHNDVGIDPNSPDRIQATIRRL
jgi:hypothetical protein